MSPPLLFFSFLFFLFFYWCRLRRNKKQTAVINITKCERISGKKKDFNLTSRQAAARATSLFSFIFRLNGGPNGWIKSISRPGPLLTCRSEFATAYMHAQNWKSFLLNGLLVFLLCLEKFTPMTMTFVDKKEGPALINKSFLIFQMLMNARSTPMTVTPMQSALTQKGHLLASATWMRITLVTGKHALLIVSRIICFTSFCSLRFTTTLTIVNFYFVGKGVHQYLCRQRETPRLPVDHLDYALVQEYTLNEISNAPKARFACLLFRLLLTFLGTLILSVF